MKKIQIIVLIFILSAVFFPNNLSAYKESAKGVDGELTLAGPPFSGKCVHVADGDTVTVLKNGIPVKIRLFGVDCPEKSQEFGKEAKNFSTVLVKGKTVNVRPRKYDNYGRTIASIFIDGKNLSYQLINAGYGWHYKRYSRSVRMAKAEINARNARRGLWQQENPQKPWNYRHGKKRSNKKKMTKVAVSDDENISVFVTRNGSKYHRKGCRYLRGKYLEKTVEEAIHEDYSACGWCKPPKN